MMVCICARLSVLYSYLVCAQESGRGEGSIWFAVSEAGSGNYKDSGPYAVKLGENSHITLAFRVGLSRNILAKC